MTNSTTTLADWQNEDAARLKALFEARTELIGKKLISQADFGEKYGIGSQGMVSQYLQARRPLNVDAAVAFAKGLGVSIEQFSPQLASFIQHAAGYVASARDPAEVGAVMADARHVNTSGEPQHDVVPIKRVSLTLQAGIMGFETSQMFEDGGTLDLPARWVEENDLVPHCLMAINVKGDSMVPLLYEKDIVVINIADTKKVSGGVYAINFNGEAVVKRLRYEGREWYLESENTEHQRRMCRGSECIIVGRVVRFEPRNFKDRL